MSSNISGAIFTDAANTFSEIMAQNSSNQNEKIDEIISSINSFIATISQKKEPITQHVKNSEFRQFLEAVSSWIIKSFNSPKLLPILALISSLLTSYGHTSEISEKDIISLIKCDTIDKIQNKKEENTLSKEESLSPDSILVNPFLSTMYTLIVSISNKTSIIIKSKNLLRMITTISTQIVEIDNVGIYYKKKHLISCFTNILKELKNSEEPGVTESLLVISKLIMNMFSKIAIRRPIYKDYMFKKAIPDKLTDVYMSYYSQDKELIKTFSLYCVFASRTADHKTFFWTKGVITTFCKILREEKDEKICERVSLAVNCLTKESEEIQEDLKEENYLDLSKKLLINFSKNDKIVFNIVSTLRRIKDDDFYLKMSKELLYTFFALFDYYYMNVKRLYDDSKSKKEEIDVLSKEPQFIVLKELIAIMGNIVKEDIHSKPFIDKNLHLILIDVKLSFIMFPKLIKNTIGALINLSNNAIIREALCKCAAFIQSIYLVLDKYKENSFIIDYELKLILNTMKNEIAVNTFITGKMFYYILLFIKSFYMNEEIMTNAIKIIRGLVIKVKGLEEFLRILFEFYDAVLEFKKDAEREVAYKYFVDDLVKFLIPEGGVSLQIEIINLLAYLSNQNESFRKIIATNNGLKDNINSLIKRKNITEDQSVLLSSAIAHLPVEELNLINEKII